ncbi:MAG: alanine--tRNA ligase [Clostridiales bacterium]|nr:alanine--tRNA ligase [Clostridiales bacterium]
MEWTSLNDLREKFLSFFESKGHLRLPSFSLIPNNDKSLLLINSGMAPMKKYFTGESQPPSKRVATCQKCIRTPDIESVGKTDRHGTYFEMLGNFSFGDYFKHEAAAWSWEFFTTVLQMPEDKLWVTIYENDDEAYDIWKNEVKIDESHIVRLGKEDNFWEHGQGPCGPCSEIYFDRGAEYGCGKPGCAPGCECDRYMEIWNNVFSEFYNDGAGNYSELKQKNIDTGMGLERLACVMQGVDNLFEVDTIRNIMNKISEISGVSYHENEKTDISLRVITDHIRSSVFMIGDGVIPSNNGRGYVLRRLIRRACRHGRLLGIDGAFLYSVAGCVIDENVSAYDYLDSKRELISKVILAEEEAFGKTIDSGLNLLNEYISKTQGNVFSGDDAFRLNDTFGFPLDLTKDILEEHGMTVDEQRFGELLENQKRTARNARQDAGADAWKSESVKLDVGQTEFTGYSEYECQSHVEAIIADGEIKDILGAGEDGILVLDKTPFYALSGGQVGDSGTISCPGGVFTVCDTVKNDGVFLHSGRVDSGIICKGDRVTASIDARRRDMIKRNHTGAHLLQAALRKVLGEHVEQAGQLVNEREVRFDFTHYNALSGSEINQVEKLVNDFILGANKVENFETTIEEAKKMGAMMLFGEKYGDIVRVVKAGDFSTELCGGTHVSNSGQLGLFKIISETSVAAGVRRITALTGGNVLQYLSSNESVINESAAMLKTTADSVEEKIAGLINENKALAKKTESLEAELAKLKSAGALDNFREIGPFKVYTARLDNTSADALRKTGDELKARGAEVIGVLAGANNSKATIACVCGADAVKGGIKAGELVREIARLAGGSGGGRPDFAMAGAKDISKLDSALEAAAGIIKSMLESK